MNKKFTLVLVVITLFSLRTIAQLSLNSSGDVTMSKDVTIDGDVTIGNILYTQSGNVKLMQTFNVIPTSQTYPTFSILHSNGYVGIAKGPTNPQYHLDVNGYIKGWNLSPSDSTLKENIVDISIPEAQLILNLDGKKYKYKDDPEGSLSSEKSKEDAKRNHYGFLAQDVQKIFPHLVYEDSLGLLSLEYEGFMPIILEVLKAQSDQISSLENEIFNLKKKAAEIDAGSQTFNYLGKNSPNPFSESTRIEYSLQSTVTEAILYVFSVSGKQVYSEPVQDRGESSLYLSGNTLSPGLYYYSLVADGEIIGTENMILTE